MKFIYQSEISILVLISHKTQRPRTEPVFLQTKLHTMEFTPSHVPRSTTCHSSIKRKRSSHIRLRSSYKDECLECQKKIRSRNEYVSRFNEILNEMNEEYNIDYIDIIRNSSDDDYIELSLLSYINSLDGFVFDITNTTERFIAKFKNRDKYCKISNDLTMLSCDMSGSVRTLDGILNIIDNTSLNARDFIELILNSQKILLEYYFKILNMYVNKISNIKLSCPDCEFSHLNKKLRTI